jgi:hypothetical protein
MSRFQTVVYGSIVHCKRPHRWYPR